MSFGKKQKQVKTQYETENQQLGRNAYPQIQPTLDRIGDLAMNPDEYRQNQLNTYYNANNSAQWSDAQRNTLRTLANATANNYAATHGGYSSAGNKYYDDNVRAVNDYNARLWDTGVKSANDMLTQDTNLAQNYYKNLLNQHDMAAVPDAVDAYNDVIDKANGNSWTNIASTIGQGLSAIPNPYTKAIGAGLQFAGAAGSKDYSGSLSRLGALAGINKAGETSQYINPSTNFGATMSNVLDQANKNDTWGKLANWYNNRNGQPTGTTPQVTTKSGLAPVPNSNGVAYPTLRGKKNKDD